MAWYSVFSKLYDATLEKLYAEYRSEAFSGLPPFDRALVVPCGTGQDFPYLRAASATGRIVGVDLSPGMLEMARRRVRSAGWENVDLVQGDARELAMLAEPGFDLVVCSLGLTVVPDYEEVFDAAWSLLAPRGTFVIFDVWAERRTLQTYQVELIARADLSRRVWLPLEQRATQFELRFHDARRSVFGGRLFTARGTRPDDNASGR